MTGMRSVQDHLSAILAHCRPLPPQRVETPSALGLVLAGPAVCELDLPGFDNSAMDGYAVRTADLSASGLEPWRPITLPVALDIAAGDTRAHVLPTGAAARIMTGAPLPVGADAIVPVEDTDGGVAEVTLAAAPQVGRHVRRRGEDVGAGDGLLRDGVMMTPGRVALLAAANVTHVWAHPRPRVAVLSTGDELLPLGQVPGHGQIIDSNQIMLAALVEAAGAVVSFRGRLADDEDAVRSAFSNPPGRPDLILTSGGVSMGAHDTVKEVLSDLGGVEFVKVSMRPGMPQGFGYVGRNGDADGIPVLTLPGNPVSSFVSFHVFALPLVRRLAGRAEPGLSLVVSAGVAMSAVPGKTEFVRVRVENGRAWPERGQGSHMLGALAGASGLAIVTDDVAEGAPVSVIRCLGEE